MGDVGGGFGQKMFPMHDEIAVVRGRASRRPPGQVDRGPQREPHRGGHARDESIDRSPSPSTTTASCRPRIDLTENVGAYPIRPAAPARAGSAVFPGPYRIPTIAFSSQAVFTNTCGRCAYRGPWIIETIAREQMMDVAAAELGIDPLELRRRNVIKPSDLPFTTAAGLVYDAVTPAETLEQAAEHHRLRGVPRKSRPRRARKAACSVSGFGVRRAVTVVGASGHRGGHRPHRAGRDVDVDGHRQPRPEPRDHHRPGRRRPSRVRPRRRHLPPGRHGRHALRARHRRQPQRRDRQRCRQPAAASVATGSSPSPPTCSRRRPRTSKSPTRRSRSRGDARQGDLLRRARRDRLPRPHALPPGTTPALEVQRRGSRRRPSRGPTPATPATVEVDPVTGAVSILRYVVSEDCGVMINPDGGRGADRRRRGAGHRRRALRAHGLRRRRQPADHAPSSTTCCRPPPRSPSSSTATSRRRRATRRLQGHGRGRRHRIAAGGRQRDQRRARTARRPPRQPADQPSAIVTG